MNKRFAIALGIYAVLFMLAGLLLRGVILKATLLALALFTFRTFIAFKQNR